MGIPGNDDRDDILMDRIPYRSFLKRRLPAPWLLPALRLAFRAPCLVEIAGSGAAARSKVMRESIFVSYEGVM